MLIGALSVSVFCIILLYIGYRIFKLVRPTQTPGTIICEYTFAVGHLISLLLFMAEMDYHRANFTKQIDIVYEGYTPFAWEHFPTLLVFYILAFVSQMLLWLKYDRLSPLIKVIALCFLLTGIFLNIFVLVQVSHNAEDTTAGCLFIPLPLINALMSLTIAIRTIKKESSLSNVRTFKNDYYNTLNQFMVKASLQPIWVLVLTGPLCIIVICIITVFGQDTHAIAKVFTETTTWHFSQKTHPPFLDHQGHYLCTVAACGSPQLVKPLRLGKRHGNEIIVNRQLQIANAFEELIQDHFPAFHKIIRTLYDRYGYPLSKNITTPFRSNLTYLLMKPLEYLFLLVLYTCCISPEKKISKQYL
ncbi:hypothetical protein QTN47_09870 [Danxiaibacter flavus]|uniref:Uncharacterized protein n=1 Tax=Danxiaibacter flavus TaxID=3049108 RepID=A0ABV3ZD46_9BACT|nr:hypothetical protein QNM32_09870 [Chitinophagaceae bacterium DXS]